VREAVRSGAANDSINVEMDPEEQFKVSSPQGIWVGQTACILTKVCSCCSMPGNGVSIDGINVEWTLKTSSKARQLGLHRLACSYHACVLVLGLSAACCAWRGPSWCAKLWAAAANDGINVKMDPEDQLKVRQLSVLVSAIVQPKHVFSNHFLLLTCVQQHVLHGCR
jgi:hypothetical protein